MYDGLGRLTSAYVGDGRPRNISFRSNGDGQIIRRDELDGNATSGDPHEAWYRFGGRQMAYSGNNGTSNQSLPATIAERQKAGTGPFRGGEATMARHVDTTNSYEAINSYRQGSSAGSYTVQHTGETLRGVAQTLWGDASLWYKLAEANGLSADAGLIEGQRLTIPVGVIRNQFNAGTVKPYNPAEAIGDVSPTTPIPPKKKGCGIGAIFLAIIAIAVTAIVAPQLVGQTAQAVAGTASVTLPATGLMTAAATLSIPTVTIVGATGLTAVLGAAGGAIVGGALAGAVGSMVSQGIGVATGIQSKFNWGAVAMAGLTAGVGAGLDKLGAFGALGIGGKSTGSIMARASLGNAVTQGAAVAAGLQDKFSWAGVAAAGIGAGAGVSLARKFDIAAVSAGNNTLGAYAANFAVSTASLMANAATHSAIDGTNFGDAVLAALPDTIALTIGGMIENGISRGGPDFSNVGLGAAPWEGFGRWDVGSVQGDLADLVARGPRGGGLHLANFEPGLEGTVTDDTPWPRSFGWKLAEFFGFHEGGFFHGLFNGGEQNYDNILNLMVTTGNAASGSGQARMEAEGLGYIGRTAWNYGMSASGARSSYAQDHLTTMALLGDGDSAMTAVQTRQLIANDAKFRMNSFARDRIVTKAEFGLTLASAAPFVGGSARAAGSSLLARLARGTTVKNVGLIGNSGYRSVEEFTDAVTAKYQGLYNQGFALAKQNASEGLIVSTARGIGSDADAFARVGLRDWLRSEGIAEGPGKIIQVNRRLYDPAGRLEKPLAPSGLS